MLRIQARLGNSESYLKVTQEARDALQARAEQLSSELTQHKIREQGLEQDSLQLKGEQDNLFGRIA